MRALPFKQSNISKSKITNVRLNISKLKAMKCDKWHAWYRINS